MATKTQKTVPVTCPACSCKRAKPTTYGVTVYECCGCGAIHGTCYLGQSYAVVLPYFVPEGTPEDDTFHYDLTCLGSEGITRRHGWADRKTRKIVQVG